MTDNELRVARFHEDAIARLAVASEALKSVGNLARADEVARIRDEVISDYTKFLADRQPSTAAISANRSE